MKELGNNKVQFKNGVVAKRMKNGQLRILPSKQWGGDGRKKNLKHLKKLRMKKGGDGRKKNLKHLKKGGSIKCNTLSKTACDETKSCYWNPLPYPRNTCLPRLITDDSIPPPPLLPPRLRRTGVGDYDNALPNRVN